MKGYHVGQPITYAIRGTSPYGSISVVVLSGTVAEVHGSEVTVQLVDWDGALLPPLRVPTNNTNLRPKK